MEIEIHALSEVEQYLKLKKYKYKFKKKTSYDDHDDYHASSVMEADDEYLQVKDRMSAAKNVPPTHCRHHQL